MADPTVRACVGLGSNLGDRSRSIEAALRAIAAMERTTLVEASALIETDPIGPIPQGPYLNAAAMIDTGLGAHVLLGHLLAIETKAGRDRKAEQRWGPRTLDLDLLLYGDQVIAEPGLMVPHPRMHEREFVLRPLVTIAPEVIHPVLGQSVRWMLDSLLAAS